MIRADYKDKALVGDILSKSFDDNRSVNYIIQQDRRRWVRMKRLMEYSFEFCYLFGEVFLSDDKNGCALVLLPDKKKTTIRSLLLDARLALSCIGLSNLKKAMAREAAIMKIHPQSPMYYLWFIGVDPSCQNKGVGSTLLKELIDDAASRQRPVFLETSTLKNIPWYEKAGFTVYATLHFGYDLFCMKRAVTL